MQAQFVTDVLGSTEPPEDADADSPFFSLEYQLRDFIAANLGTISINGARLRLYIDLTGRDGI